MSNCRICDRPLTPKLKLGKKTHCKVCHRYSTYKEDEIQMEFFQKLHNTDNEVLKALVHHIPNGGKGGAKGDKNQKLGVKAGVWDICIPLNPLIYIEFKTFTGRLSKEQITFKDNVLKVNPTVRFLVFRSPTVALKEILCLIG